MMTQGVSFSGGATAFGTHRAAPPISRTAQPRFAGGANADNEKEGKPLSDKARRKREKYEQDGQAMHFIFSALTDAADTVPVAGDFASLARNLYLQYQARSMDLPKSVRMLMLGITALDFAAGVTFILKSIDAPLPSSVINQFLMNASLKYEAQRAAQNGAQNGNFHDGWHGTVIEPDKRELPPGPSARPDSPDSKNSRHPKD